MQPFSHTFFQDLLAGHCLSMHSYSHGTMLDGDMRLLCSATMPRRTTTVQSPRPGWRQPSPAPLSLSPSSWGRTCHPRRLLLDKALAGQTQRCPWAHGEREVGLRISRGPCQMAFLWSYCLFTPGPIQSKCSCKASLDTQCCFCHAPFGWGICSLPGFHPSEFLL